MHPELTDITQFVSLHSTAIANWVYLVLRTRHCMAHDRLQGSGEALRPHPPPVGTDTGTATARAIVSLSYHYASDSCRARTHCLCAAPTARAALMYLCQPVPCMHSLSCAVMCMHLRGYLVHPAKLAEWSSSMYAQPISFRRVPSQLLVKGSTFAYCTVLIAAYCPSHPSRNRLHILSRVNSLPLAQHYVVPCETFKTRQLERSGCLCAPHSPGGGSYCHKGSEVLLR